MIRKSLKSALIDLSGTIHIDNECTPGAVEALKKLRNANFRVKFVTNTTKESRNYLHQRLTKLGFHIDADEIYSSLWAARDVINKRSLKPMFLIDDKAMEDFKDLDNFEGDPNAVVVGLAPAKFNWPTMNSALRILLDGGQLVGVHEGRYYRTGNGKLSLGPGPFLRALTYSSAVQPFIVGKPSKDFFIGALQDTHTLPEEAVMIGDDVRDDVQGAVNAGMDAILVKTGKFRESDLNSLPPGASVVETFADAVQSILDSR